MATVFGFVGEPGGPLNPYGRCGRFSRQNCCGRYIRRKNLKSEAVSGRIYSSDGLFY